MNAWRHNMILGNAGSQTDSEQDIGYIGDRLDKEVGKGSLITM